MEAQENQSYFSSKTRYCSHENGLQNVYLNSPRFSKFSWGRSIGSPEGVQSNNGCRGALTNSYAYATDLALKVRTVYSLMYVSEYLFQDANSVPEEWREVTTDQRRMLRALEGHDDLLWVAVNPPAVTQDPPSGYTSRRGQNTM